MKVTEIVVTAGRTFNHPHEQFSNLRPEVTLRATLEDGEDAVECAKGLQQKAEGLVEDHKNGLLRSIEDLWELGQVRSEYVALDRQLKGHQERLEEIRRRHPGIAEQLSLSNGEEERS